jgi:hypothetical protein
MDIKEKRRKYYIDNRDRINERNKQYYYDNIEERKKYNNEYWSAHGHKYVKKRSMIMNINQNKVSIIENTGKDINIYIKIIFFMLHH